MWGRGVSSSANLEDVLDSLRTVLEDYRGHYPELRKLEEKVEELDRFLKVSWDEGDRGGWGGGDSDILRNMAEKSTESQKLSDDYLGSINITCYIFILEVLV